MKTVTEDAAERTDDMTALSDAIFEKAFEEGYAKGYAEGINICREKYIRRMLMKGLSIEFIADDLEEDIETVRKVAGKISSDSEMYR